MWLAVGMWSMWSAVRCRCHTVRCMCSRVNHKLWIKIWDDRTFIATKPGWNCLDLSKLTLKLNCCCYLFETGHSLSILTRHISHCQWHEFGAGLYFCSTNGIHYFCLLTTKNAKIIVSSGYFPRRACALCIKSF